MDSPVFYILFMIYIIVLCCLTTISFVYRTRKSKILEIQFVIRILLVSGFTIYLLDTLPYSVMDIREIPAFNINISIIILLLLSYSAIIYELSKYDIERRVEKKLE